MGIDHDPTVQFLARLNDESLWAVRRNIPIFEPHTRIGVGPDGKPKEFKVTAADLPEIAENANRLLREKGVPGRLTNVHTIRMRADGGGMEPVPDAKVVGYQVRYRVGTYGPDNKPAVLCDWLIYPDQAAKVDRSPHRSVEYQHAAKLIRGAAVMVNDPYLDMGVVANSRDDIHIYAMGSKMPAMGPGDASLPAGGKDKSEEKPEAKPHTPEEEKLFEKCMSYCRMKYGLDESWPAQKKEEKKPDEANPSPATPPEKGPVTAMATDKQIELYQQQLAATNARLAGLELERDQERCTMLLYSLEQEGFRLSDEEKKKEFGKLAKIPHTERQDRVKELRAIYADRKVPGGMLDLYHGHVEPQTANNDPNNPFAEPWYHKAAMAYMLDHPGMQYQAACDHIQVTAAKK